MSAYLSGLFYLFFQKLFLIFYLRYGRVLKYIFILMIMGIISALRGC